jgi:hypothetical protein
LKRRSYPEDLENGYAGDGRHPVQPQQTERKTMTSGTARTTQPEPARTRHSVACLWFWAWAVVGVIGALGTVSLGPIALGPAIIASAALSTSHTARRSAFGLFAGAGLVSLFIAYVQRQGPGTTCWHTTTAAGCDQHLNPIPWLLIGLLLLIGAVVLQQRQGD